MCLALAFLAGSDRALAASQFPQPDVRILEQSANHVRLVYQAALSADFIPPAVGSSSFAIQPLLIGIPPGAEVVLKIVEAGQTGAAGATAEGDVAKLGDPFMLRRQWVIPVLFDPTRSTGRIVVDIHWREGPAQNPLTVKSAWEEVLYKRSLLNYEQAKQWRVRRQTVASKTVAAAAGERLKITIEGSGLYSLSGRDLAEAGIALEAVRPEFVRLLYGGGRVLGLSRSVSSGVDLSEIAIDIEDGGDGSFDLDDAISFYGEGVDRWERVGRSSVWRQNLYTKQNVYWLELDGVIEGLRVTRTSGALLAESPWRSSRYLERLHEEEERSVHHELFGVPSGYDWYFEEFRGDRKEFDLTLDNAVPNSPAELTVRFWGTSGGRHQIDVRWNNAPLPTIDFSGDGARTFTLLSDQGVNAGQNRLVLSHRNPQPTRLDWFELTYPRELSPRDGEDVVFNWAEAKQLAADDGDSEADQGDPSTAEFHLSGYGTEPRIFDISRHDRLREITDFTYDESDGSVLFQDRFEGAGNGPRYLVTTNRRQPATLIRDQESSLKEPDNGADYIVITHADFHAAAERLATWRGEDDRFGTPLKSIVVDVADIYDEFSGGLLDPMAIRSFVKYAADNWETSPFFILLMGDGTHDYKNNSGTSHPNWMPAYQEGITGFDEWFVRIEGEYELPDLAIGRLPVQSLAEAEGLVDKIINYDREPEIGPWQARALVVADDVDPGETDWLFVRDADVAAWLMPLSVDVDKLYMGNFPLEGRTKPSARTEFIRQFNLGSAILMYVGHGNLDVLAHEQLFVVSRDISELRNGRRLPLMYTAASQIGVFDDPSRRSMPEVLLNLADGGVIGFISATRVGMHDPNMFLAHHFLLQMFRGADTDVPVGLGLTLAKQKPEPIAGMREIIQRYSLLGDPATRLSLPGRSIDLDLPVTLAAMEEASLSGQILDDLGQVDPGFDCSAWIRVFDAAVYVSIETERYRQPGAPIFRSLAEVRSGRFAATFVVPRDVTYDLRSGRVSVYAWRAGDNKTAFGSTSRIQFTAPTGASQDETGPLIDIAFRGQRRIGEELRVPARPVLQVSLTDESGINITGEIGHHIELDVDGEVRKVTDAFSNREGTYRSGRLEYELPVLTQGSHTIGLRAWDNANNSSRVEVDIVAADLPTVSDVLFYPNPIVDGEGGHFTYLLEAATRRVHIWVFSVAGRLVAELEGTTSIGYNQVRWAPEDLSNGTYFYTLRADLQSGGTFRSSATILLAR